jgi:hypothetical protein
MVKFRSAEELGQLRGGFVRGERTSRGIVHVIPQDPIGAVCGADGQRYVAAGACRCRDPAGEGELGCGNYDAVEAPAVSSAPPREKLSRMTSATAREAWRSAPTRAGSGRDARSPFSHSSFTLIPYTRVTRWQTSQLPTRPTLPLSRRQRNSEPHRPVPHPHLHPLPPTQLHPPCPTPDSTRAPPRQRSSLSPRSVSLPLWPRHARAGSLLLEKPHASYYFLPASLAGTVVSNIGSWDAY